MKFQLASLKILTNSKNCFKNCIRIYALAFLLSNWSILSCAGCHRQLSVNFEQIVESKVAIEKAEQAS
jgi:hypothetical protein